MSKIVVAGVAGFIGWHVAKQLLHQGYEVVGVDNLNDAYDVRLKEWRLRELRLRAGFEFRRVDVACRKELDSFFSVLLESGEAVEAVINLAARAGVRPSVRDPWAYYVANVVGTLNLLEICRQSGVGKFVLASTSSVYGDGELPFHEDQRTDRLLSPYAASKSAAEGLCHVYHHLHGLDISVLRYFTVYGPAGRPDMSYFRFIKSIAEGEKLLVHGDGSQTRDFTYVDDIADGTVRALRAVGYEVINLGSDRPVQLREMIRVLESLLGRKAQIDYGPSPPEDVRATWADVSKAARLLDWRPTTSLQVGLQKAVEWYLENHELASSIAIDGT